MAYGGMRITSGIPIGDRVSGERALGTVATGGDRAAAHSRPSRAEPPLHCWVSHAGPGKEEVPGSPLERSPGVLVEWQHDGDQWWGLVVFVTDDRGHAMIVTRLVAAESLAPA